MNKVFSSLIVGMFLFLFSCGEADNSLKKEVDSPYGGTLRLCERRGYETLNPMMIQNIASFQVASQIYENLLRFDEKDLSLQPSIAESWKVDDAGLVYTFKIKKGVYFHDDECFEDSKGRELTAHDVEYSFKRICLTPKSYAYRLFNKKVVGVKEFSLLKTSEKGSIEGIKVIDDNTIQITLIKPSSNFLYSMAQINTAIISKEAVDKYGNKATIGTGPFKYVSAADSDEKTVLVRNENYHLSDKEGNKLPYLDTVVFYYINEGKEQMKKFEKGELDVVSEIPPLAIAELVQNQIEDFQSPPVKYVLENSTTLLVNYLELNTVRKPFNNIKVRQAFAMAIDKTKIVDEILKGSAFAPGNHGVVSPALNGYDFSSIIGLEFNPDKAKLLLAKAGYPDVSKFPTIKLSINENSSEEVRLGLEIQKQLLANLGINIELDVSHSKDIMGLSNQAKGDMYILGWLADYPAPDNFLSLLYGGNIPKSLDEPSFPNTTRYSNKEFDKLYEQIIVTIDKKKRNELCLQADQIVANEVPIIPLWYEANYRLVQSYVKGYPLNAMGLRNLTRVKIVPRAKEVPEN